MSDARRPAASTRTWVGWTLVLLALPAVLPLAQGLAFWCTWPLSFVSSDLYASAYGFVEANLGVNYLLRVAILMGLQAILVLGLNIVPGFCGLLDLGYVAFYCVGAYTCAILMNDVGLSFWLACVGAVLLAGMTGVARGYPTLPLSGDYYAIVTFGFAELVVLVTQNWTSVTRGARGFADIRAPELPTSPGGLLWNSGATGEALRFSDTWSLFGVSLAPPVQYYYLMVACLLLVLVAVLRLRDSRIGRAWFAIREDEIAAEALGVDLRRTKTLAFAVSAAIGGLAGAFYAGFDRNLHWTGFQFVESIMVLCAIVLGGLGSVRGILLGTILLVGLTEALRDFREWRWIVYGVLMIVIMRYRPAGLFPQNQGEFALAKD